ncbi:hypothetical protein HK105_200948 [Polyrhizophydium stewartii]|uniref:Thioredoxin domain-containing protein n=1 Tax=Polyrhizophydium stewartii TaxID=2732419 RepID=A0ABR4NIL2_9FUNG
MLWLVAAALLLVPHALRTGGGPLAVAAMDTAEEVKQAYLRAEEHIFHLEQTSFDTVVKRGDWLVFFGATCLTPQWLELQKKVDAELRDKHFRVAKVECTRNEDLCESLKLDGYPTVFHYRDGVREKEEVMERTAEELLQYARKHARESVPDIKADAEDAAAAVRKTDPMEELLLIAAAETQPQAGVNPKGEITIANGPWFVMFHAPWCGHCKSLAPTWELLASELKGKVNVGKADCESEKSLVGKYKIRGFPTLIMFNEPVPPSTFSGSRQLDRLKEFAIDAVSSPSFTPVSADEIPRVIVRHEIVFFFAYDAATTDLMPFQVMQSVAKMVKAYAKIYVSPSAAAFKRLRTSNDGKPVLVAVRDGGLDRSVYEGSFSGDGASRTALRDWIMKERFPLVTKLDSSTQSEILEGGKTVALALVDPNTPEGKSSLAYLRGSARFWKTDVDHPLKDKVKFAWMDASLYAEYIKSVYGVKRDELPRFVVATPKTEQYYDAFATGKRYDSFAKDVVHRALKEVLDGNGRPKHSLGLLMRSAKALNRGLVSTVNFVSNNVLLTLVLPAIAFVALAVYALRTPTQGYHHVPNKTE